MLPIAPSYYTFIFHSVTRTKDLVSLQKVTLSVFTLDLAMPSSIKSIIISYQSVLSLGHAKEQKKADWHFASDMISRTQRSEADSV